MDDESIGTALSEAQSDVESATRARVRRQDAVMAARDAGWSKARIARQLGVKAPTVDAIVLSALQNHPNGPH